MERLTYWQGCRDKALLLRGNDRDWRKTLRYEVLDAAIQRLAAYEDTGLEPEEITAQNFLVKAYQNGMDGITVQHLLELLEADKEGRLVVLPCKVGDTVYRNGVLTCQKETVIVIGIDDEGIYIGTTCGTYRKQHIGKTVFLTREEAEAALKKE